jgi:hypothetical protein
MMKNKIALLFLMVFLSGCSSDILKKPQTLINATSSSLKTTTFDLQKDARLSRTEFLLSNELFDKKNFENFVCAPDGQYDLQRTSLEVLEALNQAYGITYAEPSKEISVLFSNVFNHQNSYSFFEKNEISSGEQLKNACIDFVSDDLKSLHLKDSNRVLPLVGIVAAAEAAKVVWDGVKALTITILQQVDLSQREAVFLAFIKDEKTNSKILQALGDCVNLSSDTDDDLKKCIDKDDKSPINKSSLGSIIQNKRIKVDPKIRTVV